MLETRGEEKRPGREGGSRSIGLLGELVEPGGPTHRFLADWMMVSPNNWGHRRRNNFD